MCLDNIKQGLDNKPYNSTSIRWKVVEDVNGTIESQYTPTRYQLNVKKKSRRSKRFKYDDVENIGFHVLISKADAIRTVRYLYSNKNWIIMKVEVEGFKYAGDWAGYNAETWKYLTPIAIFSKDGKRNISNKY